MLIALRFKGFFRLFAPTNPGMDGVRTTQEQLSRITQKVKCCMRSNWLKSAVAALLIFAVFRVTSLTTYCKLALATALYSCVLTPIQLLDLG